MADIDPNAPPAPDAPAPEPVIKITLDKSKPHGVVFPPENNAHFEQDGFYFTHQGDLVHDMLDEAATKRLKRRQAFARAEAARIAALRSALESEGLDGKEIDEVMKEAETSGAAAISKASAQVDLIAWAKGQQKYVFGQIRKAFQDQHAKIIADKRDALEWLVDNGQIKEDDIAI